MHMYCMNLMHYLPTLSEDLGGVYTRMILRKTFSKTLTLFIVSQRLHWFVSYARNEYNEYNNTGSLVSVGCGLMQDKVKITCQTQILSVSNCFWRLHEENERCEVVPFSKYMFLLPDSKVAIFIARLRWISVNEQPKW